MLIERACRMALVASLVSASSAPAQQSTARLSEEIRITLRAFYFNWERGNWEALTADVLAAKVVAHRFAPRRLLAAARRPSGPAPRLVRGDEPATCSPGSAALPDGATITIEGDWAEASVPRCAAKSAGTDEFLLIRFQQRWRLVYIGLAEGR